MESFSATVKRHLIQRSFEELEKGKWKSCCTASFINALLTFVKHSETKDTISYVASADLMRLFSLLLQCVAPTLDTSKSTVLSLSPSVVLKVQKESEKQRAKDCEKCDELFLRGAFISCGTVLDPARGYHVAFNAKNDENARRLLTVLDAHGIKAKCEYMHSDVLVYFKESERIVDLFTLIGAQKYSMILVNQKIERSIRADINRRQNFDAANLKKTVHGAQNVISQIHYLESHDLLVTLPDALQKTAKLRLSYPEVSLDDLCAHSEEKITKSGLNHRLQKLVAMAEKHRKEETEQ